MDFVPVHYSRVNALKIAHQPIQRGPNAPGAFRRSWTFSGPAGFLFDPSRVQIVGGTARLHATALREGIIETGSGFSLRRPRFISLDGHGCRSLPALSKWFKVVLA